MGMVYGKAAFNAFLEILPIGILLSSKEKEASQKEASHKISYFVQSPLLRLKAQLPAENKNYRLLN